MFKKILSLLLVVVMCAGMCMALASCSDDDNGYALTPVAKESIKIGLITLHDENSTYDKNFLDAMDAAVANLGLNKDTQLIVKKNIPESDECYKAAAELVDAGCQVIFANSFGHEDFMMKAAAEFPEVQFCHATGTKAHTSVLPNYHNAFASIYEGRFAAGVIGGIKLAELKAQGKLTDANYDENGNIKIGYVGAFPYAEVISGYTSYYLGVKVGYTLATTNSAGGAKDAKIVMEVKYTNSWYDEAAEKSAAEALIGSGCALMSQHADSYGAPTACQAAGVPNVSYNGSTKSVGATTYLISSKINWAPYYELMVNAVIGGYKIQDEYCGGFAEGSVQLTELNEAAFETEQYRSMAKSVAETPELMYSEVNSVFDSSLFTVKGETLKSYMANVHDDAEFKGDTEVMKKVGEGEYAYYVFQESVFRSAPYFDIIIDGIKVPAAE